MNERDFMAAGFKAAQDYRDKFTGKSVADEYYVDADGNECVILQLNAHVKVTSGFAAE